MTTLDHLFAGWLWESPETRADLRKTRRDVRRFIAEHREQIDAEAAAMTSPPRTIEGHIASLREGNPERWQQLNREWLDPVGWDVRIVEGEG
jgi:hypothetical protein